MEGVSALALVLVLALVGLASAGLFLWREHALELRSQWRFRAFAERHGLRYWPTDPYEQSESVADLLFASPSGIWFRAHLFSGDHRGRQLLAYEYRCRESRLEVASKRIQVVAMALPASRPSLDIRPEGRLSRRSEKDLRFEHHEFNAVFRVRSPRPRWAHDVLHPRMMEWMLADPRARTRHWAFHGSWLMVFRDGAIEPEQILPHADFLAEVLAFVPDHVWSDK
jgi:hypothetical protein